MHPRSWPASALLQPPFVGATLRAADIARRAALDSYPLFVGSGVAPPHPDTLPQAAS
jgi:hypothetical protein